MRSAHLLTCSFAWDAVGVRKFLQAVRRFLQSYWWLAGHDPCLVCFYAGFGSPFCSRGRSPACIRAALLGLPNLLGNSDLALSPPWPGTLAGSVPEETEMKPHNETWMSAGGTLAIACRSVVRFNRDAITSRRYAAQALSACECPMDRVRRDPAKGRRAHEDPAYRRGVRRRCAWAETYFFRTPEHFAFLQERVRAPLLAAAHTTSRP